MRRDQGSDGGAKNWHFAGFSAALHCHLRRKLHDFCFRPGSAWLDLTRLCHALTFLQHPRNSVQSSPAQPSKAVEAEKALAPPRSGMIQCGAVSVPKDAWRKLSARGTDAEAAGRESSGESHLEAMAWRSKSAAPAPSLRAMIGMRSSRRKRDEVRDTGQRRASPGGMFWSRNSSQASRWRM